MLKRKLIKTATKRTIANSSEKIIIYSPIPIDRVRGIVLIFALLTLTKSCWDGSSVGRAED